MTAKAARCMRLIFDPKRQDGRQHRLA